MNKKGPKSVKMFVRCMSAVALSLMVLLGTSAGVSADEADDKRILKAMSDYVGAQESLSFEFDATLEVVTKDDQKLALASSGTVTLNRPDKIRILHSAFHLIFSTSASLKDLSKRGSSFTYRLINVWFVDPCLCAHSPRCSGNNSFRVTSGLWEREIVSETVTSSPAQGCPASPRCNKPESRHSQGVSRS